MDRNEETIVMARVFDAPRSRVFEAWTRAEHLAKWFGPQGRGIGAKAASMLAGMQKGWAQTVDRLGVLLNPKPRKEM
jgi:uncharacterized protein YndB with AHSA1/START domain